MSLRASVFVGLSVDGFMARLDGSFDFLPEGGGEDHGYKEFFASIDALVIGRGTWETVAAFDTWPYEGKLVVVLSSRPVDFGRYKGKAEHMAGSPKEIVAKLEARGVKHAYIDGGVTVQRFLNAGLIQRLTVTRVPVLIGTGRPLFGPLEKDLKLKHIATRSYQSGLVQSEYEVLR